ncbi:MAG TPA: methyltransferase domain-containing protein, partial [Longimicrobiales bacterium]|nr:methyltransferase domain-containing protein [Longimicrobiales bacterium]
MTLLGERRHEPEVLDTETPAPGDLARSLAMVTEVNRRLGGVRSLRRHLAVLARRPRVRLLDVGTGNGDVLRDLLAWGRRSGGGTWTGVGLDLRAAMLALAARASALPGTEVHLVQGDGLALPFGDASFDGVFSTLTLHHFRDADASRLVSEMARVSRGRVVVSDLERCLPAYLGARILAATRWRHDPVTRNDGPLSVRRSFTLEELAAVGRRAGLPGARVVRHFPWRIVLV